MQVALYAVDDVALAVVCLLYFILLSEHVP